MAKKELGTTQVVVNVPNHIMKSMIKYFEDLDDKPITEEDYQYCIRRLIADALIIRKGRDASIRHMLNEVPDETVESALYS